MFEQAVLIAHRKQFKKQLIRYDNLIKDSKDNVDLEYFVIRRKRQTKFGRILIKYRHKSNEKRVLDESEAYIQQHLRNYIF